MPNQVGGARVSRFNVVRTAALALAPVALAIVALVSHGNPPVQDLKK